MAKKITKLPKSFKPLMWSYDFDNLDLRRDKKSIVVNTINYGTLSQWKWITDFYGLAQLKKVLTTVPVTELRERVRPLVELRFSISEFNNAARSSNR